MTRFLRWLPLALLALPSAAIAEIQPRQANDCLYKFLNVSNNVPSSVGNSDLADVESRVAQARKFWDEGQACIDNPLVRASPDFAQIEQARDKAKVKLEKIDAEMAVRREYDAALAEATALLAEINASKPEQFEEMARKATAMLEKGAALKKTNELARTWYDFGRTLEMIDQAMSGALERKKAAQNAAIDQRLREGAITNRFSEFKLEDAIDQAKVRQAFEKVAREDLVVFIEDASDYEWWPAETIHILAGTNVPRMECRKEAIQNVCTGWEPNFPKFYVDSVLPDRLPKGTMGVIWAPYDEQRVVFVSMDGGRSIVYLRHLANAVVSPDQWLKPFANSWVLPEDVGALAKLGQIPEKLASALEAKREAAAKCAVAVWDKAQPQFDKIEAADLLPETRQNRYDQLNEKVFDQMVKKCEPLRKQVNAAYKQAADAYMANRKKTWEANSARLKALLSQPQAQAQP